MSHKIQISLLVSITFIVMACSLSVNPKPPSPTTSAGETQSSIIPMQTTSTPISTALPVTVLSPTVTTAPTSTTAPTPTTVVIMPTLPSSSSSLYIDDRSTPSGIIISYFNAVNRHEYLRAYSYWKDPATQLGSLNSFSNGYAKTASVELVLGQITGSAGAGQAYYTVPAIIKGTATNGQKANYAACYVVHISQPGFQAEPPFAPMSIIRGNANSVSTSINDTDVLASACSNLDYPTGEPVDSRLANLTDLSKNNYLDNRSGPIEVVSSLLNALNKKEYVRAYYYWQKPASTVGPYNDYAAGFADTEVVTATFGTPSNEGGAGQLHYQVPLAMKVQTTTNTTQTFLGCYTLHLARPANQASAPFEPLGIIGGQFKKVNNNLDTAPLLATACK